jgi:site-specific recombinase XerD
MNIETERQPRRSLAFPDWPKADRQAWEHSCRPSERLKPGGAASHLAPVSREDFSVRYGLFLGFLNRTGRLHRNAATAGQVTPKNVEAYVAELQNRVSSVTVYNCIYKLRRAAQLLSPTANFTWLAELEKDFALVMEPRTKFDRLVTTDQLSEAGLTLIIEAEQFSTTELARARGIRNGLMLALLGMCPSRRKNFATLEIGCTFKEVNGNWWITLPSRTTKTYRVEERPVPAWLNPYIRRYLESARPMLLGSRPDTRALWLSSTTGQPMTVRKIGTLISKVTCEALGVDVSPHLFRTAIASTAAAYGGATPHLASALLNHTDPHITEEHYNRASSFNAGKIYGDITMSSRRDGKPKI